jgi:hypothetical protein
MATKEVSQQPTPSEENILKAKRSTVKRKHGSKTRIRYLIIQLEQFLCEAEQLNINYLTYLPDKEHDKVLAWYDVEFSRVNGALSDASAHLEQRTDEECSEASSTFSSRVSNRSRKSITRDSAIAKAKAAAAETFFRKQREMAKEKLKEIENQSELQKELLKAQQEAERLKLELEKQRLMSEEADKTRELEAEAACLRTEARELDLDGKDPENINVRLKDFEENIGKTPEPSIDMMPTPKISQKQKLHFDPGILPSSTPKPAAFRQSEDRGESSEVNGAPKCKGSWISQLSTNLEPNAGEIKAYMLIKA